MSAEPLLPSSGTRQLPGSPQFGPLILRIWKITSSGSVGLSSANELVWPAVHADERFCEIEANTDCGPNFSSR